MEEEVADFFWQVTAYRVQGRCIHELSASSWLVLCGLLAACEDFEQLYDYACDKQAVLAQFLRLPAGLASSYTLQRVFSRRKPVELEASLPHWGQASVRVVAGQQLAIDGKQVRGPCLPGQRQASVQVLSVWATAQRLGLAQTPVASKANELVAIPPVLDLGEVAGSVVSLDAIGCQPPLAPTLVERRADQVLARKQTQRALFEQVPAHLAPLLRQEPAFVSREKDHGRGEERRVGGSRDLNLVEAAAAWAGLAAGGCVQTRRWQQGREQRSTRYYLPSRAQASAGELAGYVRGHWRIENDLHWQVAVTFAEEACRVRQGHAPRNLATLRKWALTPLRREPTKMSLPRKRKKAARNDDYLRPLLSPLAPQPPNDN